MDGTKVGLGAVLLATSGAILAAAGIPGGRLPLVVAGAGLTGYAVRALRTRLSGGRRRPV